MVSPDLYARHRNSGAHCLNDTECPTEREDGRTQPQ